MGLLLSHNCTLFVDPDKIRFHVPGQAPVAQPGKRGRVAGFSRASRKRMFDMLHTLRFSKVTFITLTYPLRYPNLAVEWKSHLRAFRERLERKYGKVQVVWKLEFQKRGAPHYHLMLYDAPFIDRDWLSLAWYEVVGSQDKKHLDAGTNIEGCHDRTESAKIVAYVSKYMGKVYDRDHPGAVQYTGRIWGIWNRAKPETVEIELEKSIASRLYSELCSGGTSPRRFVAYEWHNSTLYGSNIGSSEYRARVFDTLHALQTGKPGRSA